MNLRVESYVQQREKWPKSGRHILAQYDDTSVVVYQAYRSDIGHFAAQHGYFGGEFRLGRMSWIKPNFLWMMYRCGWGTKPDQEVVLAVTIQRTAFDEILAHAVHSSYVPAVYETQKNWQSHVKRSDVRLQWDPDHAPGGAKVERRAIQLGLRGDVLHRYAREWIVRIDDISDWVAEQRNHLSDLSKLETPREDVYLVDDPAVVQRLGLNEPSP